MWSPERRALLRGLALAPLLLAACGFEPLYARRNGDGAAPVEALRSVRVEVIPDRAGQILRNELETLLNPRGAGALELYALKVDLATRREEVLIRRDETPTRNELAITADFALTSLQDNRVLTRGRVRSVNAFDVVASDYANIVAEADALESNLRQIARQIQTRLAIHFQRQAEGKPPALESRT